jgi:predicted RNA-binding protein YlqC (UPF0109 family)
MKEELYKIIWHIVDQKDNLTLKVLDSGSSNTIVLSVAGEDYGRIVGSKGRTIEMLQNLVDTYSVIPSVVDHWRLILETPTTPSWGLHKDFEPNQNWDIDEIKEDLTAFISLFGDCEINVIDTGTNVIFECIESEKNYLDDQVKDTIAFLTLAMCKGYGRNATLEFFK